MRGADPFGSRRTPGADRRTVERARARFTQAFGNLTAAAFVAFDAETERHVRELLALPEQRP